MDYYPNPKELKLSPLETIVHKMLAGEPYDCYTREFIAKAFGCSKGSVGYQEAMALRKMRQRLEVQT